MKRPLSRVAVAIVLSALLVAVAVLPAAADGPISRGPFLNIDYTFDRMCSFPVHTSMDQQNETETYWEKQDGSVVRHVTGVIKVTWTNLDTGYSISTNNSGPLLATFYPDGSQYLHFPGPQGPPYASPNWFMWGSEKVYITPAGDVTWTFHGRGEEVCAALNHAG